MLLVLFTRCCNFNHFVWSLHLQPGEELFPLDDQGQVIADDSNFLDTWEVNIKEKTTLIAPYFNIKVSLYL